MSFLSNAIISTTSSLNNFYEFSPLSMSMNGVNTFGNAGNDFIIANGNNNFIDTGFGDDDVLLNGDFNFVFDESGDNSLISKGNNNEFEFMYGNNVIQSDGNNNKIFVSNGCNYVEAFGENNFINLGNGNSSTFVLGDNNEIFSNGTGDKTVHFWDANLDVNFSDGNHVIKSLYDLIMEGDDRYIKYSAALGIYTL